MTIRKLITSLSIKRKFSNCLTSIPGKISCHGSMKNYKREAKPPKNLRKTSYHKLLKNKLIYSNHFLKIFLWTTIFSVKYSLFRMLNLENRTSFFKTKSKHCKDSCSKSRKSSTNDHLNCESLYLFINIISKSICFPGKCHQLFY